MTTPPLAVLPPDLDQLKRPQLQRLCKQHNLKASGKNTDMIARLTALAAGTEEATSDSFSGSESALSPVKPNKVLRSIGDSKIADSSLSRTTSAAAVPSQEDQPCSGLAAPVQQLTDKAPTACTVTPTLSPLKPAVFIEPIQGQELATPANSEEPSSTLAVVDTQPSLPRTATPLPVETSDAAALRMPPTTTPKVSPRARIRRMSAKMTATAAEFGAAAVSVLNEMKRRVADAKSRSVADKPSTPMLAKSRLFGTPPKQPMAATEKIPRGRFQNLHEKEFGRMDSIAHHYSVRKPPATKAIPSDEIARKRPGSAEAGVDAQTPCKCRRANDGDASTGPPATTTTTPHRRPTALERLRTGTLSQRLRAKERLQRHAAFRARMATSNRGRKLASSENHPPSQSMTSTTVKSKLPRALHPSHSSAPPATTASQSTQAPTRQPNSSLSKLAKMLRRSGVIAPIRRRSNGDKWAARLRVNGEPRIAKPALDAAHTSSTEKAPATSRTTSAKRPLAYKPYTGRLKSVDEPYTRVGQKLKRK
ncbi:hypothetical protein H4R34_005368 [Dimargaris verticillata]|uniref:SAP domain-containing protein n=1 Tax=Dimargaris verticillata TaxID=2761393 RepID=A0A9W8EAB4_9FUNG|nr:hypothetical protein H4R34_005368 [Dimargaris verticillata]